MYVPMSMCKHSSTEENFRKIEYFGKRIKHRKRITRFNNNEHNVI